MENVTLEKAAKILGTKEEILKSFPKDIKEEMLAVMEMVDTDSEEECRQLYEVLKGLWIKGMNHNDMKRISEDTGIDLDMLLSLDEQAQMMIDFEYAASGYDAKTAYRCFHEALQVRDIPDVAKLIGTDTDKLKTYPREVQEQLCGAYKMEYDENTDNKELITELNAIIQEAEGSK